MSHRPRAARGQERVRAAAQAARDGKRCAMAAALVQIGAAFDGASAINDFKLRIEGFIRLGPEDDAVRARYGARAAMLAGHDLDEAIAATDRWWRDERKAFNSARRGTRLALEVLGELRVILRLMRFIGLRAEFAAIIGAVRDGPAAQATE